MGFEVEGSGGHQQVNLITGKAKAPMMTLESLVVVMEALVPNS